MFLLLIILTFSDIRRICTNSEEAFVTEDLNVAKGNVFDAYKNPSNLEDLPQVCEEYENEDWAEDWLHQFDIVQKRNNNRISNANYDYSSNMTAENEKEKKKLQRQSIKFGKKLIKKMKKFKWAAFRSERLKRLFNHLSTKIQSRNETVSRKLMLVSNQITNIYNNGRPCFVECLEAGEDGIVDLFDSETNYDRLLGFWSAWRNETGRKLKELFIERMNLENLVARDNGFSDAISFQMEKEFEEKRFSETVVRLYEEILPLYKQLHGYVRYCLSRFYPDRFDKNGSIPAHILGNVWAQQWNNILPIMQQCQGNRSDTSIQDDVNKRLQYISVRDMYKIAEEFYTSIDMYDMTENFWQRSVVTKRPGTLMDCHASAHDFSNGVDFRIKMCTKRNINDFSTIHHEMGHVEYFMAYRHLPLLFQGAANPGFHEAVGDTIALSVKTPQHLRRIGLISEIPQSKDFDINYLMIAALEKVAFIPFALTMHSYTSDVYNGTVLPEDLNRHWWDLRYRYQGLKPPIKRTEDDFDPGAKYHMALGISYIRYFTSFIYQFQFYESMCKLSGHQGPLHRCDFYHSKEAGHQLRKMLSKGKSQHWRDTLEILTDNRDISSKSLLTFFEPLYQWLKSTNERLKIPVGW